MNAPLYHRSPDVLWRNVGSEVILTRPKTEALAELSDAGADVWRLLDEPITVRDAATRLDGFPQGAGELQAGVRALLDDLVWHGYCTRDDR